MFGMLAALRTEREEATSLEMSVPDDGVTAEAIAAELGLPPECIEGVFCNHTVYGLDHIIHPGDRVAFVPYGTPGPHRFTLGLYSAGKRDSEGA
jgi:hypothetical protein